MAIGCACGQQYVGLVVDKCVIQTRDDDYFSAVIWDGETFKTVGYESTAYGPCSACNLRAAAVVDASEELRVSYKAYCHARDVENHNNMVRIGRETPYLDAKYIVVRGRKIAKGTSGIVKAIRQTMYGHMAALKTDSGIVWVDSKNIAVLDSKSCSN
jgi:hypothetical protein